MPTQVQFRRGSKAQNDSFSGAAGEIVVNNTNQSIRIHDGTTQGGFEQAKADLSNHIGVGVLTATSFVGALTGTATSTTNIPNLSGDISSVNTVTTLATVNSNVGSFGSGGAIPTITVNAKGLVTGVTTTSVNPANDGTLTLAVSGTGLSGSASFTANQSGASSFTVTSNATNTNTVSTIVARDASGNFSAGTITASLTGTASNVTTNANLTGHVTSVGNAAVLGSFTSLQLLTALTDETGTGANVFATSPTLVTPALGTPSSGTLTNCTFPTLNQNTTGSAATLTTGRTIAITGDLTYTSGSFNGSGNVTGTGTLATVNANVGSFGSGGAIPTITVNAKGLITGVTTTAVTSGTTITNDTSTNASRFLTFTSATSGSISAVGVSTTKLIYNPSTGALTATDFNSTSDINLKDNIQTIVNPLDKIIKLNGVTFNWKENQKPSIGVIAQELQEVLPELVSQGDVKTVNYNGLIGVLIEAVKEQQKQIEELKDLVKNLTTPQ